MFKFAMFDSILMGRSLSFFSPDEATGTLRAILRRVQGSADCVGFHYYLLGRQGRLDPETDASAIPDGAVVVLYHDHHAEALLDQVHSTFSNWVDASIPYHDKYKKIPAPVLPANKKDPEFPRCQEAYNALLKYVEKGHDAVDILLEMDPAAMRALLQSYSTPCTSLPKGKTRADLCVTYDFRPVSAYAMLDAEKRVGWVVVKRDLFDEKGECRHLEKELKGVDKQIVSLGLGPGGNALGALARCSCCKGKFVHVASQEGVRRVRTRTIDRCTVIEEHYYGRIRVDMRQFPLDGGRVILWARLVYDGIGTLCIPGMDMRLTGFFDSSDFVFGRKTRQDGACSIVEEGGFGWQCRLRGFGVCTVWGMSKALHPCVRGQDPGRVWSFTSGLFDDHKGVQKGTRRVFLADAMLYAYDGTYSHNGKESKGVLRILNPVHGHLNFDGRFFLGCGKFWKHNGNFSVRSNVAFRGKVQSVTGDGLFAVGTFNDAFEPEGECFVRYGSWSFSGTFLRGSLCKGSLHDGAAHCWRGTFEALQHRAQWPGAPRLLEGILETEALTARGTFAKNSKGKNRLCNGRMLDRRRGTTVFVRKGRVDLRSQARVIQTWWRAVRGERRVRGLEEFVLWLAKKREVREIEVQYAACTIQAYWSECTSLPRSPKSVSAVEAFGGPLLADHEMGRLSKTGVSREQVCQLHMQEWRDDCRRLGEVQARLSALGKARLRQCHGYSSAARRKDLVRLHRKKCLGVRRSRVAQCKSCTAGNPCAHLRSLMELDDDGLDAFWFQWRAEL